MANRETIVIQGYSKRMLLSEVSIFTVTKIAIVQISYQSQKLQQSICSEIDNQQFCFIFVNKNFVCARAP